MAKYIICKKCNNLVNYEPHTSYENHTSYTHFKCPVCGHEENNNVSHVHYGNDALN